MEPFYIYSLLCLEDRPEIWKAQEKFHERACIWNEPRDLINTTITYIVTQYLVDSFATSCRLMSAIVHLLCNYYSWFIQNVTWYQISDLHKPETILWCVRPETNIYQYKANAPISPKTYYMNDILKLDMPAPYRFPTINGMQYSVDEATMHTYTYIKLFRIM